MKGVKVEAYLVLSFAFGLQLSDFVGSNFYADYRFLLGK